MRGETNRRPDHVVTPDECANYFTAAGYEPEQMDNALGDKRFALAGSRIAPEDVRALI